MSDSYISSNGLNAADLLSFSLESEKFESSNNSHKKEFNDSLPQPDIIQVTLAPVKSEPLNDESVTGVPSAQGLGLTTDYKPCVVINQYSKKNGKFCCNCCNEKFVLLWSLEIHLKKVHNMTQFKCITCNVSFKSEMMAAKHVKEVKSSFKRKRPSSKIFCDPKQADDKIELKCPSCGKVFGSQKSLHHHISFQSRGYFLKKSKIYDLVIGW